ncbi:hypothetical protein [Chryseobacterium polytrichastri]|nr:hypothetical protein [Chryseobacterium polytrichastri]
MTDRVKTHTDKSLGDLEASVKQNKLELGTDSKAISPWDYRKLKQSSL